MNSIYWVDIRKKNHRANQLNSWPFPVQELREKKKKKKLWREVEVPFSVTFQAHGMVAVGQYNLAIHFHAYSTFFLSFSIYIRTLPVFLIISPSIPLHAYCFLVFIFCISNTSLKLQYRGINYRWPQQVLDISKVEGNKLHKLTTLNP